MKANASKTDLLYIAAPQRWNLVEKLPLRIGDVNIEPSDSVIHLGFTIDRHLNLKQHISSLRKQCFFQLRRIGRIRRYLTEEATKSLFHALVLSRFDYCNSFFVGLPAKQIHRLQVIQNAAACLIFRLKNSDDAMDILKKLHWLPVARRIDYKIIVVTYRCLHGQAPSYLSRHILPHVFTRSLRSESHGRIVFPPQPLLVHYGDRAFSQFAPRLWNNLPVSIRLADDFSTFKRLLKTYLFYLAFKT